MKILAAIMTVSVALSLTAAEAPVSESTQTVLRSRAILPASETNEDKVKNDQEIIKAVETTKIENSFNDEEVVPAPAVEEFSDSLEDIAEPVYRASKREIDCLVSAIYHEARGEPIEGRIAVVEVILARRDSGRWPTNACSVIAQRAQFSFVRGGFIPPAKTSYYEQYRDLVIKVLSGELSSSARGATYFHATYAKPKWRHGMRRVSQIGRHLFYASL